MNIDEVFKSPLAAACGAPRHDHFIRSTQTSCDSIAEMISYGRQFGISALLRREYPDVGEKNIIVNVIDGRLYVADGNHHLIAFIVLDPGLTIEKLNDLRPGLVRVWEAGVEKGKNTAANPYDVYIPIDVDISRIPGAKVGTDYFKNPPSPTNIVPGDFPADSKLLDSIDRGRPLYQTALAVMAEKI